MNIDPTISHLQNTFYSNYSEIWARFGKSQIDRTATWMNKPLLEKSAFKKILVIEFGHTRIKAAAISTDVTAAQLCDIKVIADRSSDWHGKDKNNEYKLAQLFNKNHPSPISQLLNEPYDAISLSFYGPLLDRSIETHHEMWQIPQNVKECIESATHSKVVADTDSVTWALGAASFLELQNEEIAYPCMAMTLGTHIGAALIEKSEDNSFKATAVEVWIKDWVQERTRHFVQPDDKVSAPIELLELDYLSRISGGESNIDDHMKTYRSTFETHFRAFVQDAKFAMEEWLNLKDKISSVIVGGGNSRFITDGT
ncbi:MAG: ROK family protein, partial [Parachlamydiales bacterium]|nr:ROK family protein [Parachlamydiales bacterium]